MILVDTSVWVDHLRAGDVGLSDLLQKRQVLMHADVVGELALGQMRQRQLVMGELQRLPRVVMASDAEVLGLIDHLGLSGSGIGWVDAHLLASVKLHPGALLWTRDKRLQQIASIHALAFTEPLH